VGVLDKKRDLHQVFDTLSEEQKAKLQTEMDAVDRYAATACAPTP